MPTFGVPAGQGDIDPSCCQASSNEIGGSEHRCPLLDRRRSDRCLTALPARPASGRSLGRDGPRLRSNAGQFAPATEKVAFPGVERCEVGDAARKLVVARSRMSSSWVEERCSPSGAILYLSIRAMSRATKNPSAGTRGRHAVPPCFAGLPGALVDRRAVSHQPSALSLIQCGATTRTTSCAYARSPLGSGENFPVAHSGAASQSVAAFPDRRGNGYFAPSSPFANLRLC